MLQRKPARGLQAEEMFQPQLLEGVEGLGIPGKLSIRNAVKTSRKADTAGRPHSKLPPSSNAPKLCSGKGRAGGIRNDNGDLLYG